jgi:hypothetical protein
MEIEPIQNKIYEIRGYRVMLDFDLAEMYSVETRVLNQSVRRNAGRFPEDFAFQLLESEWQFMSSQIVMTSRSKRPKTALPLAFTEHGVVMLASILRSDIAVAASIKIVRAFVYIRQMLANRPVDETMQLQNEVRALKQYVDDVFTAQHDLNAETRLQLEQINETLTELQSTRILPMRPRRRIGFSVSGEEEMIE